MSDGEQQLAKRKGRNSALDCLSPRQRAFVHNYCGIGRSPRKARWNATESAKQAGYHPRSTHDVMKAPAVQAAIAEVVADLRKRHEALAQRAIDELEDAAFTKITDVLEIGPDGIRLKDNIPPEAWAGVQEIHDHPEHGLRVKMVSKTQALSLLLKAIGHLQPERGPRINVQVNGANGVMVPERLMQVREILGIRDEGPADG